VHYLQIIVPGIVAAIGVVVAAVRRSLKSLPGQKQPQGEIRNLVSYLRGAIPYGIGLYLSPVAARRISLRRYGKIRLAHASSSLYVPGIRPREISLDECYVPIRLLGRSSSAQYGDTLLRETGATVVLGEPGSGKSSLITWLYRRACEICIASPGTARLPIKIELKTLPLGGDFDSDDLGRWFLEDIRANVSKVATYNPIYMFDTMVKTSGILLLLDGLDEVQLTKIDLVARLSAAIARTLADLSPRNAVVLTTRPQAFDLCSDVLTGDFVQRYGIEKLSVPDVEEFVRKWPFQSQHRVSPRVVIKQIQDNVSLGELATNPLVLAMYLAHCEQTGTQPAAPEETRTGFLRLIINELLYARRRHQITRGYGHLALKEQREQLLGRLAFEHLMDPAQSLNDVPLSLCERVQHELIQRKGKKADLLTEISVDTGLITIDRTRNEVHFMHIAICEYLAGLICQSDKRAWANLVARASENRLAEPRLAEALIIAVALHPRNARSDMFADLRKIGDADLVLRAVSESQTFNDTVVAEAMRSRLQEILTMDETTPGKELIESAVLLAGTISDSRRVATAINEQPPLEDVRPIDLLEQVSTAHPRSFDTLFAAMANRDFDQALQYARGKLTENEQIFRLLSRDAPAAQLLAAAIAGVHSPNPDEQAFWSVALCRAALERRTVAEDLSREVRSQSLDEYCERVARSSRWSDCFAIRGSLYGQVLTMALQAPIGLDVPDRYAGSSYPGLWLPLLTTIRPRRWRMGEFLFPLGNLTPLAGCIVSAILVAFGLHSSLTTTSYIQLSIAALVAIAVLSVISRSLTRLLTRESGIYQVLNLAKRGRFYGVRHSIRIGKLTVTSRPISPAVHNATNGHEPIEGIKSALISIIAKIFSALWLPLRVLLFGMPLSRWNKIVSLFNASRTMAASATLLRIGKRTVTIEVEIYSGGGK
jgi:hypothetical protein